MKICVFSDTALCKLLIFHMLTEKNKHRMLKDITLFQKISIGFCLLEINYGPLHENL